MQFDGTPTKYALGPKTGNRRPLFTASVKRGMRKVALSTAAALAASVSDKDVAAFVRYVTNLIDYEKDRQP